MGFLRRIAGVLGFTKEEHHESNEEEEEEEEGDHHQHQHRGDEPRRPTKGFSVKVPVPVDRAQLGPLLTPTNLADGGVQGLRWYARRLKMDEDGDVADEFLDEVLPEKLEMPSGLDDRKPQRKFVVKYSTRPAIVRKQMISAGGKIHLSVEYQGNLLWV